MLLRRGDRGLNGKSTASHAHLAGLGTTESLTVEEFLPYWRRLRRQLAALLDEDATTLTTRPRLCESCEYCEFQEHCQAQWRSEDSLAFVANSRESDRNILEDAGIITIAQLAARTEMVADLREEKRQRLTRQAALQVASRERSGPPAFEFIEVSEDPVYGHGFEQLPAPDRGDVFFDFEGDPFWTPQHDLMFLAGLLYQDDAGEWIYDERWAHNLGDQQSMIKGLVEFFAKRREEFPHMHVYHYNHTERSTIERLMRDAEDENLFASLVETGLFVDLFTIAKNAVRVGTESYSLKQLEHLVEFRRSGAIEGGAMAVVEYEEWMDTHDEQTLRNIALYNRDDVEATKALRDWLVNQRPADLAWREAVISEEEYELDTDELVEGLHLFPEDSAEYLLGDLLNYWRRERSADVTPKYVALNGDYTALYDNMDYLTNLQFLRVDEPTGRERNPRHRVDMARATDRSILEKGDEVLFAGVGVPYGEDLSRPSTSTSRSLAAVGADSGRTRWGPGGADSRSTISSQAQGLGVEGSRASDSRSRSPRSAQSPRDGVAGGGATALRRGARTGRRSFQDDLAIV